jgi:hypothetical protein
VAFITDEQARGMAEQMRQRALIDPEFAEDCESVFESMPFQIRYDSAPRPIVCECCGTRVMLVSEAEHRDWGSWKPAIWEAETLRKHTLPRCGWMRENGPHDGIAHAGPGEPG